MGRKLKPFEKEDRRVEKIVARIISIEKQYGVQFTRRACFRYYQRRGNELALKRQIKEAEKGLIEMKKKASNR